MTALNQRKCWKVRAVCAAIGLQRMYNAREEDGTETRTAVPAGNNHRPAFQSVPFLHIVVMALFVLNMEYLPGEE